MSANTNPILPCEENEVVKIALTTIQEASLDDDFIPIVKLDKTYKEEGCKYTESSQKVSLSPYLEEREYTLESVMFDNKDEFVLRFEVKKGNSAANDNRGDIHAIGRGVKIISQTEFTIKYDQKILLRISKEDIKNEAYIDFYANDNDRKYYSITNVHCGRVRIEKNTQCICEERVRAYMRMLRVGEGTVGKSGYTKLFGGSNFTKEPHNKDTSDHPQIKVFWYTKKDKTKVYSSAAGAYQVMAYTWNDEGMKAKRTKHNIKNYSPESQDKFCVVLFKYKRPGMLSLIMQGKIKEATEKCGSYEWASLPPGRYGQPIKTMEQALKLYEDYLKEELAGNSDLELKKGFLKEFEPTCQCGGSSTSQQSTQANSHDSEVFFDNASDSSTVSPKSIGIIKKIAKASKNTKVYITSGVRTPRKQAEIMYSQSESYGANAQYKLYGTHGDKIIDVYVAEKGKNKTKENIIEAMEKMINEVGASNVSKHCGDHNILNVFDISVRRLTNPKDFLTEAKKLVGSDVKKFIDEPDRGCYHFEITQ